MAFTASMDSMNSFREESGTGSRDPSRHPSRMTVHSSRSMASRMSAESSMVSAVSTGVPKPPRSRLAWLRGKSRTLCDSWRFCVLTTALTFYALFGDDFRLAAVNKRVDILFNILTIFCVLVFSLEIVASSLGREEYFLGFFSFLDFFTTVTLILDLTWVGNELFCSNVGDGSEEALKTSRASRAGARASRTVRIIRLMRLVKLYKTYRLAMEQKKDELTSKRRTSTSSAVPGEGEDEDLLKDSDLLSDDGNGKGLMLEEPKPDKGNEQKAETRVGKKLSDMTTRRVIILVLVMLFCMPWFAPAAHGIEEFRSSANMGAELSYERWRSWCLQGASSSTLPWCLLGLDPNVDTTTLERRQFDRRWYEKALLSFLYSHHQGDFAYRLYWVGVNSTSLVNEYGGSLSDRQSQAQSYLGDLARLNQQSFLGTAGTVPLDEWDSQYVDTNWQMNLVPLARAIQERLVNKWVERCLSFVGVLLQTDIEVSSSSQCSITEELRCSEVEYYVPDNKNSVEENHFNMVFAFDTRSTTQLEAGLSMLQTIFICFAVGVGAMSFAKDANELLLNPIERMIAKMETIKDNPLEAMRLGDLEYRREEIEHAQHMEDLAKKSNCWKMVYKYRYMRKAKEPMETVMLEKTIIKLGGLLALGFGEAGAEIIGQNMQGGATAGVNAMVPGQTVDAIIGFCNIRNFMDATEVLKEKVMLFVNQVGEIVHGCVDDYHGAPNKNIGDAFLLIWRLSGASPEKQTKLADMAMMSFVRIVAEVSKSRVLAVYRSHPGLLQRLRDFRVQMGFGLHWGWAIEGAIGSEFKIDASYLSPNVNVASRLEAATTQYGVWMLISHFMINLCTQEMALVCRLIDHVTVKGLRQPVRLYTIDLDCMKLDVVTKGPERVIKNRFKIRQLREAIKTEKWADDYNVCEAFETDEDLIKMRSKYSSEFFKRFSMAYRNYEAGEWMAARDMLFTCHYSPKSDVGRYMVTSEAEWPEDGPTVTLLHFMRQTHYCPLPDWPGYRELNDK